MAGVPYCDIGDYTQEELLEIIDANNERLRRDYQFKSLIAYKQTWLNISWLNGENLDSGVMDIFPFWTEEEKDAALLERMKAIMNQHVQHSKGGEKE